MKLRIRRNLLRLRVSNNELAEIAERGGTEDSAQFAPNAMVAYREDDSGLLANPQKRATG